MRYKFYPKADEEFDLAIDFYKEIQTKLGEEFVDEVHL